MHAVDGIRPYSPRRAAVKELALFLIRAIPDIAERSARPAHLTASAFVVDPGCGRVLLVRHPKFGRWLQPGGHCDGDPAPLGTALREVEEETALRDLEVDPTPFDVDIHPGEPSDSPHMHIDIRFAAAAEPGISDVPPLSPEGLELRWFEPGDLESWLREPAEEAVRRWAIVDSNHGPPPYQSGALTD